MEPALTIGLSITAIFVLALLARKFRLPLVIGVLIAGSLVGPHSLIANIELFGVSTNSMIITDVPLVEVFATIGAALILFEIGLEFSILSLAKLGAVAFIAAGIKMGLVTIAGYIVGGMLGLGTIPALVLGFLLSMSSTPIIVRILEDKGKFKRPEVQLIIAMLVVEDLAAVFMLGIFANLVAEMSQLMLLFSLFKVIVTFVFAYIILSRVVRALLVPLSESNELLVLAVVSLVLVIGYVSQFIGLSFSVGAFLAGSVIAGSSGAKKIGEIMSPFNTVFASMFFFSIGMLIDPALALSAPVLVIVMFLLATIVKFGGASIATYFLGSNGRSACFSGAALLVMSEVSLMIAKQATVSGLLGPEIMSISAGIVVVTAIMSSLLISYESELYAFFVSFMPAALLDGGRTTRRASMGVSSLLGTQFKYVNVVSRLPMINFGSGHQVHRPQERITGSANRSAVFLALSLLALFLLITSQLGNGFFASLSLPLAIVFVLSSLAFTYFLRSTLEFLASSFIAGEHKIGLLILKNATYFAIMLSLGLSNLAAFLFVPASWGVVPAALCGIFAVNYFFRLLFQMGTFARRTIYRF